MITDDFISTPPPPQHFSQLQHAGGGRDELYYSGSTNNYIYFIDFLDIKKPEHAKSNLPIKNIQS